MIEIMPFGPYKHYKMYDVPKDYLKTLCESIKQKAPNKRTLNEKFILKYGQSNNI